MMGDRFDHHELARVLDLVLAKLDDLAADVRALRQPVAASPSCTELLAALHARHGAAMFTAAEVCGNADDELRDAIVAAAGIVSARSLGRLLSVIEGVDHDGMHVRRVGEEHRAALWQVAVSSVSLKLVETHQGPCDEPDDGA